MEGRLLPPEAFVASNSGVENRESLSSPLHPGHHPSPPSLPSLGPGSPSHSSPTRILFSPSRSSCPPPAQELWGEEADRVARQVLELRLENQKLEEDNKKLERNVDLNSTTCEVTGEQSSQDRVQGDRPNTRRGMLGRGTNCFQANRERSDPAVPCSPHTVPPPVQYVVAPPLPQPSTSHLEELLNRQSTDIAELKAKLTCAETNRKEAELTWREHLSSVEGRKEAEISEVTRNLKEAEASLEALRKEYKAEIQRLESENESREEELRRRSYSVYEEMQAVREDHENRLMTVTSDLTEKLQEKEKQYISTVDSQRLLVEKCTQLEDSLAQCKAYSAHLQAQEEASSLWEAEKEETRQLVEMVQAENRKLHSDGEQLRIRVDALQEIVAIQERHLGGPTMPMKQADSHQSGEELPGDGDACQAGHLGLLVAAASSELLTRWREQVYKMLIQRKASELSQKEQEAARVDKAKREEEKVKLISAQVAILEKKLVEKEADLGISRRETQLLQASVHHLESSLTDTKTQQRAMESQCKTMADSVSRFHQTHTSATQLQTEAEEKLKAMNQRLRFAASRLTMVAAQVSRKEARLNMGLKQVEDRLQEMNEVRSREKGSLDEEQSEVRGELQRVTEERDLLAAQILEDSRTLGDKVESVRQAFEEKLSSCETEHRLMKNLIDEKNTSLELLKTEVSSSESMLADALSTRDVVTKEIEELKTSRDSAVKDAENALALAKDAVISDLKRELAASRREQAKTVVRLRQAERRLTGITQKSAQSEAQVRETLGKELERAAADIHRVTAERDLLGQPSWGAHVQEYPHMGPVERTPVRGSPLSSRNPNSASPVSDVNSVRKMAARVLYSDSSDEEDSSEENTSRHGDEDKENVAAAGSLSV